MTVEVLVNQDSNAARIAERAIREVEYAEGAAFVGGWVRGFAAGEALAEQEPYEPQMIEPVVKSES